MMAVRGREHCVKAVLTALADGRPKSARDVVTATGIDEKTIFHLHAKVQEDTSFLVFNQELVPANLMNAAIEGNLGISQTLIVIGAYFLLVWGVPGGCCVILRCTVGQLDSVLSRTQLRGRYRHITPFTAYEMN